MWVVDCVDGVIYEVVVPWIRIRLWIVVDCVDGVIDDVDISWIRILTHSDYLKWVVWAAHSRNKKGLEADRATKCI